MKISQNTVVTMDYTLKNDAGDTLDSVTDGSFAYLHGAGNIIPGLERALQDRQANDEVSVAIKPVDAYGERDPSMQQVVPKDMFQDAGQIDVGRQFQAQAPNGAPMVITVVAVEGDKVTIDGNHPLAGVPLHFDVRVLNVREASAEEIAHGHVHGPDGHHH